MVGAVAVTWHKPWYDYLGNSILPALCSALLAGVVVSLVTQQKASKTTLMNIGSEDNIPVDNESAEKALVK
jgi:hypothetical protein